MRKGLPMILVRVIVGLVFLTEGILKFVHPAELGSGRFAHIGLPFPYVLAPIVGAVEIAAGAAVILNLFAGDSHRDPDHEGANSSREAFWSISASET